MPKTKITEYDTSQGNNTDIDGLNINTGCPAGNMDNAVRTIMSHLKKLSDGTAAIHDTMRFADPADETKQFRFDGGTISAGQTRVLTIPDESTTLVGLNSAQTLTNKTIADPTFTGTVTLPDATVSPAKITQIANLKVLGNVSGAAASPSEVDILDEDDFASDSAAGVPTQQSVKAYVDTAVGNAPQVVAWARFNSSGTLLGGFNAGSVVRFGLGLFRLTFATPLSSANFAVSYTVSGGSRISGVVDSYTNNVNDVEVQSFNNAGARTDPIIGYIVVIQ